jgi:hypothetical protein
MLLGCLLVGTAAASPIGATEGASQAAVTSQGATTFGARVEPIGQTPREAVTSLEAQLGASLPLVSEYLAWDATFPNAYFEWLAGSGHQLLLSVKLKRMDGTRPSWSALAEAPRGSVLHSELRRWAVAIRDIGVRTYFVFHKEPNEPANRANGTPEDYRAAWARVARVFDQVGADNAQLVFAMAGSVYGTSAPDAWYPGDEYVDVIASTGVNYTCSLTSCNWRQQQDIMRPMVEWATAHPTQALGVVEGATVEDPNRPLRKRTWINNAHEYVTSELGDRMAFYNYWSSVDGYDYRLTTSPGALDAGTLWVTDPVWQS